MDETAIKGMMVGATCKFVEFLMMLLMNSVDIKHRLLRFTECVERIEALLPGKMAYIWMKAVQTLNNRFLSGTIGRLDSIGITIINMKIEKEFDLLRLKLTGASEIKFTEFSPAFLMMIGSLLDTVEVKNHVKAPFRAGYECRCMRKCTDLCQSQKKIILDLLVGQSALPWKFEISSYGQSNVVEGAVINYSWNVFYTCEGDARRKDLLALHYDTDTNEFELKGCKNQYKIKLAEWKTKNQMIGHMFNVNSNASAVIIKLWLRLYDQLVQQFVLPHQVIATIPTLKTAIGDICEWYQLDHDPAILEVPNIYWAPHINMKELKMVRSLSNIVLTLKKGLAVKNGSLVSLPYLPNEIITIILTYVPITSLVGFGKQRLRW